MRVGSSRGSLRRWLATSALLVALAVPSAAHAGSDTIYNGVLWQSQGIQYGPQHSLSSVWVSWYNMGQACAQAWQPSGGVWVGSSFCASNADTNVGHSYCACALRQGAGWPFGASYSQGYWRQFW